VPPYVSFLKAGQMESPPYQPVHDMPALKELLAGKLEDLALEPGQRPMDLVLFRWMAHDPGRWGCKALGRPVHRLISSARKD
jgi:hypothetical protein